MQGVRWNHNFAYGVGLIATDGCLSSDKRHIEFCSKDLEQIINFKKSFCIKNKITRKGRGGFKGKPYYRVQFGDVRLYDFLIKIGLTPKKSHSIDSLDIPRRLFADFLRGVIDGDGSIGYFMHPESKQKQFRTRITSASKNFLKWLNNRTTAILNVRGIILKAPKAF